MRLRKSWSGIRMSHPCNSIQGLAPRSPLGTTLGNDNIRSATVGDDIASLVRNETGRVPVIDDRGRVKERHRLSGDNVDIGAKIFRRDRWPCARRTRDRRTRLANEDLI